MSRAAIAILSTGNLLHNVGLINTVTGNKKMIAMIKANGYGHGLRSTALRLEKSVTSLGVASIDEALALRRVGITIPITLMEGVFEPEELVIAARENFHIVFHSNHQIRWLHGLDLDTLTMSDAVHGTITISLTAWLKVDTGMGRIGFGMHEANSAYDQLSAHPHVRKPIGIMSHFACSDEPNHQLNTIQINNFKEFCMRKNGPQSFCNSAAIFSFPDQHYDVVRPGLALYGINPFLDPENASFVLANKLKPVMTLQTKLIAVRSAYQGTTLGYGARYTCQETMPIGVIALGYGDGYPRTARDGTPILVNGKECSIVGRVSMDMMTIDLRNCPNATINDPVILWGEALPLERVARYTDQTPYDILTAVQARVKFQWI